MWLENDEDYRGIHQAPGSDAAPLHDLTQFYPDDIYGPMAARYYGHGEPRLDQITVNIMHAAKNKPNMPVKIYRAIPKTITGNPQINPGDWVTINRTYAVRHGRRFAEQYQILSKTVPARTLFTDGNSIHEWGYWPN